jgi:hypothetical protein
MLHLVSRAFGFIGHYLLRSTGLGYAKFIGSDRESSPLSRASCLPVRHEILASCCLPFQFHTGFARFNGTALHQFLQSHDNALDRKQVMFDSIFRFHSISYIRKSSSRSDTSSSSTITGTAEASQSVKRL